MVFGTPIPSGPSISILSFRAFSARGTASWYFPASQYRIGQILHGQRGLDVLRPQPGPDEFKRFLAQPNRFLMSLQVAVGARQTRHRVQGFGDPPVPRSPSSPSAPPRAGVRPSLAFQPPNRRSPGIASFRACTTRGEGLGEASAASANSRARSKWGIARFASPISRKAYPIELRTARSLSG